MDEPTREQSRVDIERDVAEALAEKASRSYGVQYLDLLTKNWSEVKIAVRKALGLLLVVTAAFELIRRAQLTEATVAGLKISNLSNLEKVLPVGVAYLAFQLVAHHTTTVYFQRIHTRFHAELHGELRKQRLHVALRPIANLWWEPSNLAYASADTGRLARALAQVWALATVVATLGFQAYAYQYLLSTYGANWLVILSLLFSLLLIARAAAELRLERELQRP
jgi:hypothetical protein